MANDLELDSKGNVVLKPVTGWAIAPVAEIAVLLKIDYSETPEDIGKGGKSIQFVLTPPKCLELAEVLTRQAKRLLEAKLPPGKAPH